MNLFPGTPSSSGPIPLYIDGRLRSIVDVVARRVACLWGNIAAQGRSSFVAVLARLEGSLY